MIFEKKFSELFNICNKIKFKNGGPGAREAYVAPEGPQKIPIGCCPQGDPMGKPYSAGMSCCCGTVYDENMQMCCQHSCAVYPNTLSGITKDRSKISFYSF